MHGAIERRVMMVARVGWRTGVGACAVVSTSSCVHYGDKASIEVLPEEDNGSSDRTALWRSRLMGPQWRLPSPFTPWSLSPNRHPPSDPFHHLPELAGRPQGFGSIQPLFRVPVQGFEVTCSSISWGASLRNGGKIWDLGEDPNVSSERIQKCL